MRTLTALFCLFFVGFSACRSNLAGPVTGKVRRTFHVEVQNCEQVVSLVANCCARLDVTRMEIKAIKNNVGNSAAIIEVEFRSTMKDEISAAVACISRLNDVKSVNIN